jgi:hypothetical protein
MKNAKNPARSYLHQAYLQGTSPAYRDGFEPAPRWPLRALLRGCPGCWPSLAMRLRFSAKRSVRHCSGEGFGLADPARDLLLGREQAHEALLLIDLSHLLGQVLGVALSEFHDRVDAARLE